MIRTSVPLIAWLLAVTCSAPKSSAEASFVGRWSGGPASCADPFAFTSKTYSPPMSGGRKLEIGASNGMETLSPLR